MDISLQQISFWCWAHIGLIAQFTGLTFCVLFIIEHIARINNSNKKPSIIFNHVATNLMIFFNMIGAQIARLSSFLTYIKFYELGKTFLDLFTPIFTIIISPIYIIKGYFDAIVSKYNHSNIVIIGTIIIIGFIICSWYRYGHYISDFITQLFNFTNHI